MSHTHLPGRGVLALACLAFAGGVAAEPGMYATLSFGNVSADEPGTFAVGGLAFPGPTVDHDICGSTATITVGARPIVNRLDDQDTTYRVGLGWRGDGALAWEAGFFNVARLTSEARSAPYAVVQPACPDATVSARGVDVERVSASGIFFGPVYHVPLSSRLELELRAQVSFYDLRSESQWRIEVTEFDGITGDELQTYPTAGVTGETDDSGIDAGVGIGLAWQVDDRMRVRAVYERQAIGFLSLRTVMLGITLGF